MGTSVMAGGAAADGLGGANVCHVTDAVLSPPRRLATRADWFALADAIVDGAVRHMSPDSAHVVLPGNPSKHGTRSDGMEGFARTLLLHGFRAAGDPESVPASHTERYLEGLASGLLGDESPWLPVKNYGHALTESATIALALTVAREALWEPLDAGAQDRIAGWLAAAAAAKPYENNWQLFSPVLCHFLRSVGRPSDAEDAVRERALASLAAWTGPAGWVADGLPATYDYYNSFALHYYPLMLAGLGDSAWSERAQTAREWLETYPSLFSSDGAPVYFGRSLTYRFGAMAGVSAAAFADALPWDAASARALTTRVVEHFLSRGALGADGVLRRGWHGPDDAVAQSYSGPAGSYWAVKPFANLLLPAGHAYWGEGEPPHAPQGPWELGLVVTTDADREVVRLANHGSASRATVAVGGGAEDPYYSRIEYSSASAPLAAGPRLSGAFTVDTPAGPAGRGSLAPAGSGPRWAASSTQLRTPIGAGDPPAGWEQLKASWERQGEPVHLATVASGDWMIHVARVPGARDLRGEVSWSASAVPGTDVRATPVTSAKAPALVIEGDALVTSIVGLLGFDAAHLERAAGSPFARDSWFPVVTSGKSLLAKPRWFVVATSLSRHSPADIASLTAERHGESVVVRVGNDTQCIGFTTTLRPRESANDD